MLLALGSLAGLAACAGSGARGGGGRYHTVAPGENLYRIGLRYGVDAQTLAEQNRIDDVTTLRVGQQLWIPDGRRPRPRDAEAAARAREAARHEAAMSGGLQFAWPLDAPAVTSRFGRRGRKPHDGIDISAHSGTPIRAAEAGKVIHAGWLGDYGNVVIVKHAGAYRTVYAHASRLHVHRGDFVDRGQRIADVGRTGNASGPHLHFEIRRGESPVDPMLYLR